MGCVTCPENTWLSLFLHPFLTTSRSGTLAMRGRLGWQSFVLFMEGCLVIVFANSTSLATAIAVLVFFSIFVQAAEGSSYG